MVDLNAEKILNSGQFLHLSRNTVHRIVSRDELNIREITVYNRLLAWVIEQSNK